MLSDEGAFLWHLMDGAHTIGDLCRAYVARYPGSGPQEVMGAIARLYESGLIRLEGDIQNQPADRKPRGRLRGLLALCTWYCWLPDMDRAVTALHGWLRPTYSLIGQAALLFIAVAGLILFGRDLAEGSSAPVSGSLSSALWVWMVGLALHVVLHEAAHAVTCKHFGRQVHRVGVGWYYFMPVAFVDTSDIWAAGRLQRVLVSAAGPYANVVLSGIAGLGALWLPPGEIANAFWSFSSIGYGLAIVNLNPLLELDGYYIAMDLLELPNLRSRALACLGAVLRNRASEHNEAPRLRPVLTAFGAASLAYGVAVVIGILLACRASVANLAGASLPHGLAHVVSWTLAGAVSMLVLNRVLDDLRRGWHGRRAG
jgi:putative peptide zinc metalloprotease protein